MKSKNQIENLIENDMIIPQWLFKEPVEIKNKKYITLNH